MKTSRITTAAKITMMVVVFAFMFTCVSSAQPFKVKQARITKNAIESLIMGIHDEIEPIKKSSIYLAGRYKLTETVDALIEELKKENNPNVKVLIAVALFMIGEERGIEEVYKASLASNDPHAVKMFNAVVYEYYSAKSYGLSMR